MSINTGVSIVVLPSRRTGIFFIVVAPAGAGKNRLIHEVVQRMDELRQLPTATTRPMRPGEQQGREHVFVTPEEFDQLIENGKLLEHQLVHGTHYYGMLNEKIEAALEDGDAVIADIEMIGARIARYAYPENTVTIFIQPPSISSLVERMRNRKETDTEIARRLMRVPMELEFAAEADYIVVNDELEHAVEHLRAIITAECSRPSHQRGDTGLQIKYVAQVIPICGEEAMRQETGESFPEALVYEGEQPHVAALRALNKAFGSHVPAGKLDEDGNADDDFKAPFALQTSNEEGDDQITFVYHYRMEDRLDPPRGWLWMPIPSSPVPAAEESKS